MTTIVPCFCRRACLTTRASRSSASSEIPLKTLRRLSLKALSGSMRPGRNSTSHCNDIVIFANLPQTPASCSKCDAGTILRARFPKANDLCCCSYGYEMLGPGVASSVLVRFLCFQHFPHQLWVREIDALREFDSNRQSRLGAQHQLTFK